MADAVDRWSSRRQFQLWDRFALSLVQHDLTIDVADVAALPAWAVLNQVFGFGSIGVQSTK